MAEYISPERYEEIIRIIETKNQQLEKEIENKDKEIATLSNDVNMLDRGLHEHKSRHEQNWTNVFNQLEKEVKDKAKKYDEQKQFTDTNARIALRFKEELAITQTALDKALSEIAELIVKSTTTCSKTDCEFYQPHRIVKCLKGHKSCCKLLYISNDYQQK